jgi:putative ABC transport system permease protein
MRLWQLILLALDGVRRTPLRVTLTSAGVAIATGALVSMVGFAFGIQDQVEEPFLKSELFNRIDVTPRLPPERPVSNDAAGESTAGGDDPSAGPVLDEPALARITALPGVALVYPELFLSPVEVVRDGHPIRTSASGLPRKAGRLRFVQEALLAGRFFQSGDAREVVLGKNLAKALGYAEAGDAVGEPLTLKVKGLSPNQAATFKYEERQLDVQVAGVWDPPGGRSGFRSDALLLPLDLIREMPGVQLDSVLDRLRRGLADAPPGYSRVVVRVNRPGDLFEVEKHLQDMGFRTNNLLTQIKDMRQAFLLMDLVLGAVGTVALVVAGLGIINTLLMAVLERYREIATFKALGASDGDIRLLFLAEAGLVGMLGGVGGLLLGRVVSWGIELVVNEIARRRGIDQPLVFFSFPWYLLLGAVGFAVAVSLISGVYPASRAARVDPIRALRGE